MKSYWKAAIAALALTAGATAAVPASAQSFGLSVGPNGGIGFSYDSGGYCDSFGCPDGFWDMPVYYGPVFWHGQWYDGPVYYRDWYGRRQFWIRGDWRFDEWRGPHPGWWREGRYGPPLGMDYYRDHGFHGRWDRGGPGYDRRFDRRDNGPGFDRRDERGGFNGPDDRRGPPAMDQRRGQPQPQGRGPAPQAAPAAPAPPPGFQPRADGRGYGHYQRPAPGAAPAAAPAHPAPGGAPPDDHRHHDDH